MHGWSKSTRKCVDFFYFLFFQFHTAHSMLVRRTHVLQFSTLSTLTSLLCHQVFRLKTIYLNLNLSLALLTQWNFTDLKKVKDKLETETVTLCSLFVCNSKIWRTTFSSRRCFRSWEFVIFQDTWMILFHTLCKD